MGADGGLNWVFLENISDAPRVFELIVPLRLIDDNWRDEDIDYTNQYPIPSGAIVSKYGTDREIQGMEDLRDILYDDELDNDTRTFEEVAIDLATRPEWQMYQLSNLEKIVLHTVSGIDYSFYCGWLRWGREPDQKRTERIKEGLHYLKNIAHIRVSDWAQELKSKLKWKQVHMAETWT